MLHHRTREYNRTMRREMLHRNLNFGWETMNRMDWDHVSFTTPETNILELDDRYVLEIALPGVVLDDVELKLDGLSLTVIAKRTPNMFEQRALYLTRELPEHFLVREFDFEDEICVDEIEARLDRGILFVSIPKIEAAIRIPVSAGCERMDRR